MKPRYNSLRTKTIVTLLSVMLFSFGCGSATPAQQRITLKFWKTFEDSQNIAPLIQAYQQKHPNVQIEYTKKNIENYEEDLLNALASNTGPDIFSIHNDWLPKYADKVVPAKEDKTFNFRSYKDTFVDVVANDFTMNNRIYGTALAVDSLGLYYNKDILGTANIATPPKTWDELAIDVRKITKQNTQGYFDRSGVAMGLSSKAPGGQVNRAEDIMYLLMLQKGVIPWSADKQNPTFTQSVAVNGNSVNAGAEAVKFYTSFANPDDPNYNWNKDSDYSIDAFANGRAAFLYSYSYTRQSIIDKNPQLNFDVASVPQSSLSGTEVNFSNYWGEVVNKQSKNADWAWDFLKFISSQQALDSYYATHKQPSSRRDLIDRQQLEPDIGVFAHANLTARSFYKPDQPRMDDIIDTMIDDITLRGTRPEQALDSAQSRASTLTQFQR